MKNDGTPKNSQTLADDLRKFLAETRFDLPKEESTHGKPESPTGERLGG